MFERLHPFSDSDHILAGLRPVGGVFTPETTHENLVGYSLHSFATTESLAAEAP